MKVSCQLSPSEAATVSCAQCPCSSERPSEEQQGYQSILSVQDYLDSLVQVKALLAY